MVMSGRTSFFSLFPSPAGRTNDSQVLEVFTTLRFTLFEPETLSKLHQIPCARCAFFTRDYRLKCTVHPSKALTEEAINCLDYESTWSLVKRLLQSFIK